MTPRHKELNRITGVTPGRTAIIMLEPIGEIYSVMLKPEATGGQLTDIIDDIALIVDDTTYRLHSADQLNKIQAQYGARYAVKNNVAGDEIHFTMHFRQPWRAEYASRRNFSLGTSDLGNNAIRLEVGIKAGANADVTLKASQLWVPSKKSFYGNNLQQFDRTTIHLGGARISYNSFDMDGLLSEVNIFDNGISALRATLDSDLLLDELTKEEADSRLEDEDMTPNADIFSVVFDQDDVISSGLPLSIRADGKKLQKRELNFRFDLSDNTQRDVEAIVQRYMPPGGV